MGDEFAAGDHIGLDTVCINTSRTLHDRRLPSYKM